MPFQTILVQDEMQSATSRIWTWVFIPFLITITIMLSMPNYYSQYISLFYFTVGIYKLNCQTQRLNSLLPSNRIHLNNTHIQVVEVWSLKLSAYSLLIKCSYQVFNSMRGLFRRLSKPSMCIHFFESSYSDVLYYSNSDKN